MKNFKILKFSSETENFKRATHQTLFFVGNSEGRDWKLQARLKFSSQIENFERDCFFSSPVSPYPLNLGVTISPPRFGGRPQENTTKKGVQTLHPQNLGGEMAPPKFRGYGLTGRFGTLGSTRKSLAIAIVRFWCGWGGPCSSSGKSLLCCCPWQGWAAPQEANRERIGGKEEQEASTARQAEFTTTWRRHRRDWGRA